MLGLRTIRRAMLILAVAIAGLFTGAAASAQLIRNAHGQLLSCPDPSVVDAHTGRYRYYLACTSDHARNAFPIRGSDDLRHWHFVSDVLPAGHQPWWAEPSPVGRYWAPAIYRVDGRWVVYFAAETNPAAVDLRWANGKPVGYSTFVIGLASARSLTGPWRTRILHYRGQFNGVAPEKENYGGVIDPSMIQDPHTGQRYLFWAEQHSSIWVSRLSADGLWLNPRPHLALWTASGWACRTPGGGCTVEGPEETYHHGSFYLLYSGASTWTGTYAVGAAKAKNPLRGLFRPLPINPILRSGNGWLGPGGCSAPVAGPRGKPFIFYHAETRPNVNHVSADRYLFMSPLHWLGAGRNQPLVNNGIAG